MGVVVHSMRGGLGVVVSIVLALGPIAFVESGTQLNETGNPAQRQKWKHEKLSLRGALYPWRMKTRGAA